MATISYQLQWHTELIRSAKPSRGGTYTATYTVISSVQDLRSGKVVSLMAIFIPAAVAH